MKKNASAPIRPSLSSFSLLLAPWLFVGLGLLAGCKTTSPHADETTRPLEEETTSPQVEETATPAPVVVVSTFAGSNRNFADGPGSTALLISPFAIASDVAGNLYVADGYSHRIRKISPEGEVSTLAGSKRGFADGPGSEAQFNVPVGIATDTAGNLYVADSGNHRIRKISPQGEVSTLAGSEQGFADGPGGLAQLSSPSGIAVDKAGNLYVADRNNHRIRKVSPEGEVSTFAGSGQTGQEGGGHADGPGNKAQFKFPTGLAFDKAGNLYVADTHNHRLRKVSPQGKVSTLVGSEKGFADGSGKLAQFSFPVGLAVDVTDNLYVADGDNHRLRKVSPQGKVSTLAGSKQGLADGLGSDAQFNFPSGLAMDSTNNLYVADGDNRRIRKVSPEGEVSTLAGSQRNFADGPGNFARFSLPASIAMDVAGNLYVADTNNHRIRKITPQGEVSTFAGSEQGFADGPRHKALFNSPGGIVVDLAGNLYVSDSHNHRIRKISPEGEVSTLAGSGEIGKKERSSIEGYRVIGNYGIGGYESVAMFHLWYGSSGTAIGSPVSRRSRRQGGGFADGPGNVARFRFPADLALDLAGNLYVADGGNHRIRKITPEGVVSTFAGSGEAGFADGPGNLAQFNSPFDIAIDASSGNLYVADADNHRIRKMTPSGKVRTLAGGNKGFADGPRRVAQFERPFGVAVDAAGNLYVADADNHRIRKISPGGEVSTLAGSGKTGTEVGGFADGPGSEAQFDSPYALAIDKDGNLYVADAYNHRIRKVSIE